MGVNSVIPQETSKSLCLNILCPIYVYQKNYLLKALPVYLNEKQMLKL